MTQFPLHSAPRFPIQGMESRHGRKLACNRSGPKGSSHHRIFRVVSGFPPYFPDYSVQKRLDIHASRNLSSGTSKNLQQRL